MHTCLHPSSCPDITFDRKKYCQCKILTGSGEHHALLKHMALVVLIHGQVWWGMVSREFIEHRGGDTGICWGAQTRSGALAWLLSNAIGADFSRVTWARVFSWQHWCIISLMLLGS